MSRVARSALIDVLGEDFIRTARAKGLAATRRAVAARAAQRADPGLTILGLQFAFLLAGTIIIENVFYLPGLGRLVFQAITQRDLIVVESVVMLLVATVIIVNLLVDLSYAVDRSAAAHAAHERARGNRRHCTEPGLLPRAPSPTALSSPAWRSPR